jgi:hypothetical protein
MMQKGTTREYEYEDRQIPDDHPGFHSESSGLVIIICTTSVLFIASAVNGLVTLNIVQFSSEFGLNRGVEIW